MYSMVCSSKPQSPSGSIFLIFTSVTYGIRVVLTLNLNFCLCHDPSVFSYRDMVKTL